LFCVRKKIEVQTGLGLLVYFTNIMTMPQEYSDSTTDMYGNTHPFGRNKFYEELLNDFTTPFADIYWRFHGPKVAQKLPRLHSYSSPYQIIYSFQMADFPKVQDIVHDVLDSIESVSCVYDSCCWTWRIQYGTIDLVNVIDWQQQRTYADKFEPLEEMCETVRLTKLLGVSPSYFKKLGISFDARKNFSNTIYYATVRAKVKFPHLVKNIDDDDLPGPIPIGFPRRWSDNSVCYYQDEDGLVHAVFSCISGNRLASSDIRHALVGALTQM